MAPSGEGSGVNALSHADPSLPPSHCVPRSPDMGTEPHGRGK